ncbi:hypothetical protein EZS27_003404 [termite gut metagenome]|uniref:DUF5077 domain-containing protein n=1 Tax=termite gut metagenome TaxID=433724 RepID=A0A5J4STK9_9ZZZZ
MKRIIFFCFASLFLWGSKTEAQNTLNIRLSGNAYVTSHPRGARITQLGLVNWKDSNAVISTYFYLHKPEKIVLSLIAKGKSQIKVKCEGKEFKVKFSSDEFATVPVGEVTAKVSGYVRVDMEGMEKEGDTFGEIQEVMVSNVYGESNYVKDFSDYWGRRGPSVHLGYTMPEGNTEWFYNEVTVPEDGEVMFSYYMAAGFGEGYFGMQYNSLAERRILFSVWSPYNTQNPKEIPEEYRVKMLRRGMDVHIGEFGNEGSGGQSYLIYPWRAGATYKFLMHVKPDGEGNTIYTAYFFAVEENKWRLIASFIRPKTNTWYVRAHSFLENFNPEQGYLSRKVFFTNQWVRKSDGLWMRLTKARFTHDATASAKVRLDYQGGVEEDIFYLKMGGFFNESVSMGSVFERSPKGVQPEVDFEELEKL